jgi:heme/copper-type cytochrome/quinol oxidase subunit 4
MSEPKPTDIRRHRADTDRNLLIGFFVVLILAGGALIFWLYGGAAGALGVICLLGFAVVAAIVMLVMTGLGRLSEWLDSRD